MSYTDPIDASKLLFDPLAFGRDRNLGAVPAAIIRPTAQHRRIIALRMSGSSVAQIARMLGRSHSYVSGVLADPTIKRIIERITDEIDGELASLFPVAVATLKRVMQSGDAPGAAVKAAETVLRSQNKIRPDGSSSAPGSAEDIIAQMMARIEVDGKAVVRIGTATRLGRTVGNRPSPATDTVRATILAPEVQNGDSQPGIRQAGEGGVPDNMDTLDAGER